MTQSTNQPAAKIRYGGITGTIWGNPGKDGKPTRYTVNYSRSYRTDDGEWKETSSFNEVDNLKLGHVITKVADQIAELKSADRAEEQTEE